MTTIYDNMADKTLNDFFLASYTHEQELIKRGKTAEEIKLYKNNGLAYCLCSNEYEQKRVEHPNIFPAIETGTSINVASKVYPYLTDLHEYIKNCEDGELILSKIDCLTTVALTISAINWMDIRGIQDNRSERVIQSVTEALGTIFCVAFNEKKESYINSNTGLIESPRILKRYPKILQTMSDEVTQLVFKNKADRQNYTNYQTMVGNQKNSGSILMMSMINVDNTRYKEKIEKPFSYYDRVVMEAIATMYDYAKEHNYADNGKVLIDLKAIDNMIRHGGTRMKNPDVKSIKKSELFESIVRLMGNYIQISDPTGFCVEGNLVNGEFRYLNGNVYVEIDSMPVLMDFNMQKGKGMVEPLDLSELKLDMAYTTERIGIYRYLLERVREIYGSYFIDDNHKTAKLTNSVPLDNAIDAIYPDFNKRYDKYGDDKRRTMKKSICEVARLLVDKNIISDVDCDESSGRISFKR